MVIFDTIFSYTAEILMAIASLIIFVFLTAYVLPSFLMKPQFEKLAVRDRGIKRYTFPNGRAISYRPDCNIEKYIPKYALLCIDGKKYIKCKLDPRVTSFSLDIIVFNCKNNPTRVISVAQPVEIRGEARSVMLPEETSFVSLRLTEVNGRALPEEQTLFYPPVNLGVLFAAVTACTVIEAFVLKAVCLQIAKLLLPRFAELISFGFGPTFMSSLLLGAALAAITVLSHKIKGVSLLPTLFKRSSK